MKRMLRCTSCSRYSLRSMCSCGGTAVSPRPAKFSPEDAYGEYRRKAKREFFGRRGLI